MPTVRASRDRFPNPAIAYFLLTGDHVTADAPLLDWVEELQVGLCGNPSWAELSESYYDAVVMEARAAGFRAYLETGRRPSGPRFAAWRRAFLEAHRA